MDLIVRVTSDNPRAPLAAVLRTPLGLDIWEFKSNYIVLSANETQADRLRSMGYTVDQARARRPISRRRPTRSPPPPPRRRQPITPLGQSVEERPIWALRIGDRHGSDRKLLFMGCHHA